MPSNIVVPEVGESIVDARVAKWLRKEGDTVAVGDPLVELETDKVDLEVAATQAGILKRIDRHDGEDVKVGEVLGVIDDASGGAATPGAASAETPGSEAKAAPPPEEAAGPKTATQKTRATPTARHAAEDQAGRLSTLRRSG